MLWTNNKEIEMSFVVVGACDVNHRSAVIYKFIHLLLILYLIQTEIATKSSTINKNKVHSETILKWIVSARNLRLSFIWMAAT